MRDDPVTPTGLRYPGVGALFLIWTAIGALASARYFFLAPPGKSFLDAGIFVALVVCYLPGTVLTPLVFRLERRFPLGTGRWPRNLALLAAISIPLGLVTSRLMIASFAGGLLAVGALKTAPHGLAAWLVDFPAAQAMFWSSVAGGYLIRTRFELREQERKAARLALEKSQLEAGLNQAQLEVLRSKLNPHFLFNSLQNISVMTKENPQIASHMLARLGDLLRAVLRQDSGPETTLREEVALTRSYVELEQMRFGNRLNVGFDIAGNVEQALVPCFVLQPLVENAVVHGLQGARKTGVITVAASADANTLVLTVTDNGVGPPQGEGGDLRIGVGLGSTTERLAKMYPDRHTFSMATPPDGGTEVRITIPLQFAADDGRPHDDEQPAVADR